MAGLFILIPLAFEPVDCEAVSIFENPVTTQGNIQTLLVQSFGILPYTRIDYSTGNIGIGISNFGNTLYQENELIFGYNRGIKNVKLGVSINVMRLQIKDYGDALAFGGNLGIGFQFTPNLNCNLSIKNINSPEISDEKISRNAIGEVSVTPEPKVRTGLQFYKDEYSPFEFKLTNAIELSNFLTLDIGVATYPETFTFGILLNYKQIGISYYTRTHPYLDLTHIIGIRIGGVK